MRYMLLCYDDGRHWEEVGEAAKKAAMAEAVEKYRALNAQGKCPMAAPLHPTSTATCVRVRDGKPLITDGPFAETREHLGGFILIDVADLDEAMAIAARHPGAPYGTVEIRPILEIPGLPGSK
jgi:hypothetical protein